MNIQATIESLIRMMRRKLELSGREPGPFEELEWKRVLKHARTRNDLSGLNAMVSAWDLQAMREKGEVHLSQEAIQRIWQQAIEGGEACLADLVERPTDEPVVKASTGPSQKEQVATVVKRRLTAYAEAVRGLAPDAPHAKVLTTLARADGFSNFQALAARLTKAPAFCPCCGSAGTVEPATTGYGCSRCHSAFSFMASDAPVVVSSQRTEALKRAALLDAGFEVRQHPYTLRNEPRYEWWLGEKKSTPLYRSENLAYESAWDYACIEIREREALSEQAWEAFTFQAKALLVSTLSTPQAD